MHPDPRKVLPVVLLVAAALFIWWRWDTAQSAASSDSLSAAGTIEAAQITIAAEAGGRIAAVLPAEGEWVETGALLVQFETATLEAQLAQAEAALAQAQANYALVAAGMPPEQIQAAVSAAELERLLAQQALDELADTAPMTAAALRRELAEANQAADQADTALERLNNRSSPNELEVALAEAVLELAQARQADVERRLEAQGAGPDPQALSQAQARLALAEAKLALAQIGPRPEQLALAQAQVESGEAALNLLQVQLEKLNLHAPQPGRVLYRFAEPGEVALPGAPLLTLARLDELTITIYLPEDRYGAVSLGQVAEVQVDSFPGQVFTAVVTHIADQAEFTPRNVQTSEGRRATVFAIRLAVTDSQGRLKPGMPADVFFTP
jgi:HlyD family secretion protein